MLHEYPHAILLKAQGTSYPRENVSQLRLTWVQSCRQVQLCLEGICAFTRCWIECDQEVDVASACRRCRVDQLGMLGITEAETSLTAGLETSPGGSTLTLNARKS